MDDRGAKALAERLWGTDTDGLSLATYKEHAAAILGPTGLFVADVTAHEPTLANIPFPTDDPWIGCSCGWNREGTLTEPYFDHLGGTQ